MASAPLGPWGYSVTGRIGGVGFWELGVLGQVEFWELGVLGGLDYGGWAAWGVFVICRAIYPQERAPSGVREARNGSGFTNCSVSPWKLNKYGIRGNDDSFLRRKNGTV